MERVLFWEKKKKTCLYEVYLLKLVLALSRFNLSLVMQMEFFIGYFFVVHCRLQGQKINLSLQRGCFCIHIMEIYTNIYLSRMVAYNLVGIITLYSYGHYLKYLFRNPYFTSGHIPGLNLDTGEKKFCLKSSIFPIYLNYT